MRIPGTRKQIIVDYDVQRNGGAVGSYNLGGYFPIGACAISSFNQGAASRIPGKLIIPFVGGPGAAIEILLGGNTFISAIDPTVFAMGWNAVGGLAAPFLQVNYPSDFVLNVIGDPYTEGKIIFVIDYIETAY